MIKKLTTDLYTIRKYDTASDALSVMTDADRVIFQVSTDHPAYANELVQRGCVFLDRVLLMEIDITKFSKQGNGVVPNVEIEIEYDGRYSDEMYTIAKQAFTTDRRFHLEPVFNSELAAPVIDAYIDACRSMHMPVFKAKHGSELLGYTIVDEHVDEAGKFFENVLGVTAPGIKGKMIASMLYGAMLDGEKARFKKYIGRVSASNIASVNLHFQLGGKIISAYDEYIYRKSSRKEEHSYDL